MEARSVIANIAGLSDDEIPLFKTALGIALIEFPNLSLEEYEAKLAAIVEGARSRAEKAGSVKEKIMLLNKYLFEELGFKGNSEDYYNPSNSLLNQVIDRRTGIPITISVIYLESAWSLRIDAYGIGFPGHFIIGYNTGKEIYYIDPFNGGKHLDRKGMQRILDRIHDGRLLFEDSFLKPVSRRMILVRMLNNLRLIYLENKDLSKALQVLECICLLTPDSATEIRDKGVLNYQLQNYQEAAEDLSHYLTLSPHASDTLLIRQTLQHIKLLLEKTR